MVLSILFKFFFVCVHAIYEDNSRSSTFDCWRPIVQFVNKIKVQHFRLNSIAQLDVATNRLIKKDK